MRRTFAVLWFALWFVTAPSKAQHALSYPHLVIFGDNYSDTLNTYEATRTVTSGYDANGDPITTIEAYPSAAYGYEDGVFTNGANLAYGSSSAYSGVWHQQLNALLPGVPQAAPSVDSGQSFAGSTNFAWGSATTASGTATVTFAGIFTAAIHNMNQQIDDYLNAGYTPDAKSLYVLFGGLNDLLADSSATSASAAAANVSAEAKRLIDLGAVNLLVANVPGISANASSPIDVAAANFRADLAADLAALQAAYAAQGKTIHLTTLDLYTLYANIMANPAKFGFTDVMDKADAVGANGSYPANVDQYLNWDGVNPTTAGHHQIALAACTALTGTATKLTVDKTTGTLASPSTLTATVTTAGTYGPAASAAPTGTVTFYYPRTILATTTATALGTVPLNASGQASISAAGLPVGVYAVYAVYNGDANFATGCSSNVLSLTVAAAASSFDFTFSPTAAYIAMEDGAAVQITPVAIGGFTGAIAFSCSNLPAFFACDFTNNQTVQVVGGGTTYYTQLDITSGTVTKAVLDRGPLRRNDRGGAGIAWAVLLASPLAVVMGRRRKLRRAGGLFVALLLTAAFGTGCAGGSSSGSMSSSSSNSDPGLGTTHGPGISYAAPGTYAVNITGTSGSLSVTHTYSIYIADTYDLGTIP